LCGRYRRQRSTLSGLSSGEIPAHVNVREGYHWFLLERMDMLVNVVTAAADNMSDGEHGRDASHWHA
jgi:hypothetical protein